jgi:hypothetical protein
MDVTFRSAIIPFVARQNANVYLLMNVGNMLSAGDPVLSLSDQPHWKVPIYCAFPEFKRREKIGELALDVNSGASCLALFPANDGCYCTDLFIVVTHTVMPNVIANSVPWKLKTSKPLVWKLIHRQPILARQPMRGRRRGRSPFP